MFGIFVDICRAEGPDISEISQKYTSTKFDLLGPNRRLTAYKIVALTADLRAQLKYYDPPDPDPRI